MNHELAPAASMTSSGAFTPVRRRRGPCHRGDDRGLEVSATHTTVDLLINRSSMVAQWGGARLIGLVALLQHAQQRRQLHRRRCCKVPRSPAPQAAAARRYVLVRFDAVTNHLPSNDSANRRHVKPSAMSRRQLWPGCNPSQTFESMATTLCDCAMVCAPLRLPIGTTTTTTAVLPD